MVIRARRTALGPAVGMMILLGTSLHSSAQSLSIGDFMDQLDRHPSYQQDSLQTMIRRAEWAEIRAERIPAFYVDANLHRNLIIPTTPVPAIAFDPSATEGAIIPLKFATRWSSKAGIQLEWDLFVPGTKAAERERVLSIEKSEVGADLNAQDLRREATLAYAAVVLASLQYESARRDSAVYAEILTVSKARTEAGREPSSTYLTARQEFERRQIRMHEAWAVLLEADMELRNYAVLPEKVWLTTDIDGIKSFIEKDMRRNHTIRSLELDRQIAEVREQGIRRGLWPSVRMNAYLGEQYYSNELKLDNGNEWFGNSFVNLALRIPLSAYISSRPSLRKVRLEYALASKKLEQEERRDRIKQQQLAVKIGAAAVKVERLGRIEQFARENVNKQEAAYRNGRLLLSDYNQSVAAYHQAQQDVWQAEYELIELLLERYDLEI